MPIISDVAITIQTSPPAMKPTVSSFELATTLQASAIQPTLSAMDISVIHSQNSTTPSVSNVDGTKASVQQPLPYPSRLPQPIIVVAPDAITEIGRHW